MSESSSDTESSCGWTVISHEGSDIEALGPDNAGECEEGEITRHSDEPVAERGEVSLGESSLELTLREEPTREAGADEGGEDHVTFCSSSETSDIITLADAREAEIDMWEEPVAKEETGSGELYLGTSSSSQYTFRETETIFPVDQSVQQEASNSSSDDDDDDVMKNSPVVRRRRIRRSTTASESGDLQETHRRHEQIQAHSDLRSAAHGPISGTLNKCILLALLIAISMGFGHFYGSVQIQKRQRTVEKILLNELQAPCKREMDVVSKEVIEDLREDLEEKQEMVLSLTSIMDKITKENQHLRAKQEELQAQRQDLYQKLNQAKLERESRQKDLTTENQNLRMSLEREEASFSALQEELRSLRAQVRELEERGAGADSIMSEYQRLKGHLQEEKQKIRSFMSQREALMAEAQVLRKELDEERKVTDRLKAELEEMSQKEEDDDDEGQMDPENEKLQAQLLELENKLKFEQQRSDLWERLYVESKEERTKGDRDVKIKKDGMMGKVKETFDAVKNSTKEFVHHHKEQIKKAKEAVKENLRKFSDSVKFTFRHFKDSASRVFNHEKRFQERKDAKPERQTFQQDAFKRTEDIHWQPQKPLHQHPRKSTVDTDHNTRKPGAQKESATGQKAPPDGCSGVFDCAYQESMSLFNKAMDPVRADEFNELLRSYLQKEVRHFHHWRELENFIKNFFHNGVFIHDQMLFTDFVSEVEDYLEEIDEYQSLDDDVFEDLDDYIYRHIFGDAYLKYFGPSRPLERPGSKGKTRRHCHRQQRKHQQQPRPRLQRQKKWTQSGRDSSRQFADVKIELGPMPFDPKY